MVPLGQGYHIHPPVAVVAVVGAVAAVAAAVGAVFVGRAAAVAVVSSLPMIGYALSQVQYTMESEE